MLDRRRNSERCIIDEKLHIIELRKQEGLRMAILLFT